MSAQGGGEIAEARPASAPGPPPAPPPRRRARAGWRRALEGLAAWFLPISIGGILGANLRFLVTNLGTSLWGSSFPFATLLINVTGSFIIGLYLALVTERFSGRVFTRLLVTTGFCGAYTTLSTFSVEVVQLVQRGAIESALIYVVASVVLSVLAAGLGIAAAHSL